MIEIREYQKEALDKFKSNDWHGIFEMATGTGKTFTSLICAKEYLKVKKKIISHNSCSIYSFSRTMGREC